MKLSITSRLLVALMSWMKVSRAANTFIHNEPFCISDGEDLEVCGYSSYIRTRRGADVPTQIYQEEKYSRKLEVSLS
jgi:hypothetical protein